MRRRPHKVLVYLLFLCVMVGHMLLSRPITKSSTSLSIPKLDQAADVSIHLRTTGGIFDTSEERGRLSRPASNAPCCLVVGPQVLSLLKSPLQNAKQVRVPLCPFHAVPEVSVCLSADGGSGS